MKIFGTNGAKKVFYLITLLVKAQVGLWLDSSSAHFSKAQPITTTPYTGAIITILDFLWSCFDVLNQKEKKIFFPSHTWG